MKKEKQRGTKRGSAGKGRERNYIGEMVVCDVCIPLVSRETPCQNMSDVVRRREEKRRRTSREAKEGEREKILSDSNPTASRDVIL